MGWLFGNKKEKPELIPDIPPAAPPEPIPEPEVSLPIQEVSLPKTEETEKQKPEEKLEEKTDDALRLIKRLRLSKKFRDKKHAIKTIWNYFSTQGEITELGDKMSTFVHSKITGVPAFESIEGKRYPVSATFIAKINKSEYTVILDTDTDSLSASIESDKSNTDTIEKLLSEADNNIITINKRFSSFEPLRKLYLKLLETTEKISYEPLKFNQPPKMTVDNEGRLIPIEMRLKTVIDGQEFVFEMDSTIIDQVTIECPLDKKDIVIKLLQEIKQPAEDANEVKSLEFSVPIGNYTWEMVGGLGKVRDLIQRDIQWPLENPELFKSMDTKLPKGILMEGPPGTGKTTIAKIIANESKSTFYTISPKDIYSMWLGETEKNWGRIFDLAREDAKKGKRAIIFIDEIDGFFTTREEMDKYSRKSFGQFCQEMDGISDLENVVIIAATNNPDVLDSALLRPGRFTKRVYIGNPDEQGRREIFKIYSSKKPMGKFDMEPYIKETEGMSGAQIKEIFDAAAFNAIERYSKTRGINIKDIKGDLIKEIKIEQKDIEKSIYSIRNVAYKPKEEGDVN